MPAPPSWSDGWWRRSVASATGRRCF